MELQTISQISKRFLISPRTLRYYEQKGLISSVRDADTAYRKYDEDTVLRLKQIILLRKLRIPLGQINEMLKNNDVKTAINILESNLTEMEDEITTLSTIRDIIKALIEKLNLDRNTLVLLEDESLLEIVDTLTISKIHFKENTITDVPNKSIITQFAYLDLLKTAPIYIMEESKMKITVTKKKFLLAGFESIMDFDKGFEEEMKWIQSELKRRIDGIGGKTLPMRLIGFWQPYQAFITTPEPASTSKAKYFFGVEVTSIDNIPSDFIVKSIRESEYAVCREERRGTAPKAEMYAIPGYTVNYEIGGDFEIFDDFGHLGENDPCDLLVPIKHEK